MVNIGIFTSGKDERSYNMVSKIVKEMKKDLDVNIEFVFSNIDEGERKNLDKIFKLANNNNIDKIIIPSYGFERNVRQTDRELWQHKYDKKVTYRLEDYDLDFIVLADYGLDPSNYLRDNHNLINIHPSTPKGSEGNLDDIVEKVIETKNRIGGVMSHMVTSNGKNQPIMYASFMLSDINDEKSIRGQIIKREPQVLYYTIKAFSEGLLDVKNQKVFIKDEFLFDPIAITNAVR